ncbi:MAG: CBS domain-containing protein [Chlorobi bacterium]|nr:CBS domain-containing protein [Chlorobiota bacterium]
MIAKQLVTDEITPLKTSNTGSDALNWMDEYKVSHLPIVNNEVFLGLISEHDIYDVNNADEPLGSHKLSLSHPYVNENDYVYDILRVMDENKLTLIPVLDEKKNYMGCITLESLLHFMATSFSVNNPGGVIVLELSQTDYSLTEIANIIESNDAKILSLFITDHPDSTRLEVIIKVNKMELGPILSTFDRYGYFVKASMGEDEDLDDLRENYDSLMNYLNI